MKLIKFLLYILTAWSLTTPTLAHLNPAKSHLFYTVVNGVELNFGDSQSFIEDTFGKASGKEDGMLVWRFENGLTLTANFDELGLLNSTISSSSEHKDSYIVAYGKKIFLNSTNIENLEDEFNQSFRCLSYFEQEGLGWMDFSIKSDGNNFYATFSALNRSEQSLKSLEGQIQTKLVNVDSLSVSRNLESYSMHLYCRYPQD